MALPTELIRNLFTTNHLLVYHSKDRILFYVAFLLLSVFYLIIDVWNKKKWAFFFIVIGLNPITIYLVQRGIITFRRTSDFFFSGLISCFPESAHDLLNAIGYMTMSWLFLYILYRLKIFLRV